MIYDSYYDLWLVCCLMLLSDGVIQIVMFIGSYESGVSCSSPKPGDKYIPDKISLPDWECDDCQFGLGAIAHCTGKIFVCAQGHLLAKARLVWVSCLEFSFPDIGQLSLLHHWHVRFKIVAHLISFKTNVFVTKENMFAVLLNIVIFPST